MRHKPNGGRHGHGMKEETVEIIGTSVHAMRLLAMRSGKKQASNLN